MDANSANDAAVSAFLAVSFALSDSYTLTNKRLTYRSFRKRKQIRTILNKTKTTIIKYKLFPTLCGVYIPREYGLHILNVTKGFRDYNELSNESFENYVMKNICIITGSRAEYGLLKGIMNTIKDAPVIE